MPNTPNEAGPEPVNDRREASEAMTEFMDGLSDAAYVNVVAKIKAIELADEPAEPDAEKAALPLSAELVERFGESAARKVVEHRDECAFDRIRIWFNLLDHQGDIAGIRMFDLDGPHGIIEAIDDGLEKLTGRIKAAVKTALDRAHAAIRDETASETVTAESDLAVYDVLIVKNEDGDGERIAQFAAVSSEPTIAKIQAALGVDAPDPKRPVVMLDLPDDAKPLTNPSSMIQIQMTVANEFDSFDGVSPVEVATIIGDDNLADECRAALAGVAERFNERYTAYLRRQAAGKGKTADPESDVDDSAGEHAADPEPDVASARQTVQTEPANVPETKGESKAHKPRKWSGLTPMLSIAFTLLFSCFVAWGYVDHFVGPQLTTISERVTAVANTVGRLEAWSKTQAKVRSLIESGRVDPADLDNGLRESARQTNVAAAQVKGLDQ